MDFYKYQIRVSARVVDNWDWLKIRMSPFCHDGIGAAIENWEYGENVNFVSSIDGYARMRIFFLAQVSGSCFVSAFPDFVFVRPAPYYFVFNIVFVKTGWSRRFCFFLQISWQSISNSKTIFVQNFCLISVFVGILNSIQDYFWNLLIFIFMNCFL